MQGSERSHTEIVDAPLEVADDGFYGSVPVFGDFERLIAQGLQIQDLSGRHAGRTLPANGRLLPAGLQSVPGAKEPI